MLFLLLTFLILLILVFLILYFLIILSFFHFLPTYRTDSVDYEFFDVGSVVFKDAESGIKMLLPTASIKFKKDWHNYNQQRLQNWKEFCLKHGIIPVIMNTKDDPLEILNNALKKGR